MGGDPQIRGGISRFLRSNALGLVAIFIALCGTASALPHHASIRSKDIANGSIRAVDLAPNAVTSPKVAPDTLTGADIRENSLVFEDTDDGWLEDDPIGPDDPSADDPSAEDSTAEDPSADDPSAEDFPLERATCAVTGAAANGDVLLRCSP